MRIKDSLQLTIGSLVVYYVMAACSAAPGSSSAPTASSGGPGASSGSTGASNGGGTSSGNWGTSSGSGGTSNGSVGSSNGSGPVPDANADETQSGSRLKANYYVGSDGSKQFAYFTDSQRNNEQCYFEKASDGSTRCLPSGAEMGVYFSDSGCTTPLALTTSCSTAPAYAETYMTATCTTYAYHLFPVGAAFTGTTVYDGTPASCSAITRSELPSTYAFYEVGSEIPPSSFQQATLTVQ